MTKKKPSKDKLPTALPPAPRRAPDQEAVAPPVPPLVPPQATEPELEQVREMIQQLVDDLDAELVVDPSPSPAARTEGAAPAARPEPARDTAPREQVPPSPVQPVQVVQAVHTVQAVQAVRPAVARLVPAPPAAGRRSRPQLAVVKVVVLGVLVAFGGGYLLTRLVGTPDTADVRSDTTPSSILSAPAALAPGETYVDSEVRPGGDVAVSQWIRSERPIDQVWLTLPDTGAARSLTAEGIEVHVDGGSVDGPASLGSGQAIYTFSQTSAVRISYLLRGAVETSASVPGRALALATSIDVKVAAGTTRETRVVRAPQVLSLGCAVVSRDVTPCGDAMSKGTWRVELDGDQLTDRVVAQVELTR